MRKNEIELGRVYTYQRHNWSTPEPLVFLSAELYETRYRSGGQWSAYTRAEHDTRPVSGTFGSRIVGYPVLICDRQPAPDTIALMLATKPEVIETGLQYTPGANITLHLLTRMASVTGLYDEIMAKRTQHEENNRKQNAERVATENRLRLQRDDLTARLEVLGIKVLKDYRHDDRLSFELDELHKLVARLEKLTGLEQASQIMTDFMDKAFPK